MPDGYIEIARSGEPAEGQMIRVEAAGRKLILARSAGELYAVDEMCSHEDYSLFLGCIRDGKIKCSLHGSWFDMRNGKPTAEPADCPIGSYALREEGGVIYVNPDLERGAGV